MPYRLEFLEDYVFRVPPVRKIVALSFVINTVGLLAFFYLSIPEMFLYDLLYMLIGLMTVTVISSEIVGFITSDIPRSWNYLDATAFQAIFWIFVLGLKASSLMNTGISILAGLLVSLVYNHTFYVLTAGEYGLSVEDAASLVSPMLLATLLYLFRGRLGFSMASPLIFYGSIAGLMLVLSLNKVLNEYFFGINLGKKPGAMLASKLLLKEGGDVPDGDESRIPVRNLSVENDQGKFTGFVPWIHPGPLGNYGGGDISFRSIHENENCFFFHTPSTHYSDVATKESDEKLLESVEDADIQSGEATGLVWERSDNFVIIGRRYGDKRVVYIGSKVYDDYERSIFHEYLYDENLTLIDIHGNEEEYKKLNYGTEDSFKLLEMIEKVLGKLEKEDQQEYRAGWSVKKRRKSLMALVEDVRGKETLILGVDENDKSEETYRAISEFKDDFDNIIAFTTDTHKSVYDQTAGLPNNYQDYIEVIEEAANNVSEAGIGFTFKEVGEIKLLHERYEELVETINILSRLYPVMVLLVSVIYISIMVSVAS